MIIPEKTLSQAEVKPPKQTKLLGAAVAGVGIVTSVAVELPWCFALVTDPSGNEHHVFVADLKKDNVTFPAEPQPYRKVNRRVGFGLWNEMFELESVQFSDLTHVDTEERAA